MLSNMRRVGHLAFGCAAAASVAILTIATSAVLTAPNARPAMLANRSAPVMPRRARLLRIDKREGNPKQQFESLAPRLVSLPSSDDSWPALALTLFGLCAALGFASLGRFVPKSA
jgi:hypothetical protein